MSTTTFVLGHDICHSSIGSVRIRAVQKTVLFVYDKPTIYLMTTEPQSDILKVT
jgi:hypothetical protein